MSIKRLLDAVERRGDIGRRVAALALPISKRPRVTSSCAGEIGLREPGEHTTGLITLEFPLFSNCKGCALAAGTTAGEKEDALSRLNFS
jgi:hypothetical protein